MGTNAAPIIANLTLYIVEAAYIDTLIVTRNFAMARTFADMVRYIDDVGTWDNEPPPQAKYGIEYKETTLPNGSTTFLGAKFNYKPNGDLILSVLDKTEEWSFNIIRFSHADSNTPSHQISGIVTGQLVRFYGICNTISTFKYAASRLFLHLLERKYNTRDLLIGFNKFCNKRRDDVKLNIPKLKVWCRKALFWAHRECSLRTQDLANRTAAADIIHRFHTPFRQLILDLEGAQTAATNATTVEVHRPAITTTPGPQPPPPSGSPVSPFERFLNFSPVNQENGMTSTPDYQSPSLLENSPCSSFNSNLSFSPVTQDACASSPSIRSNVSYPEHTTRSGLNYSQ